jgi:hypothetical protein
VGIGNRGEIDEGDPIGKVAHDVGCGRNRQPRLADAAGTGQCQQPHTGIAQQRAKGGQFLVAGNQGRQLGRDVRSAAGHERDRRHVRQGRGAEIRRRGCGHDGPDADGRTKAMDAKHDGADSLRQSHGWRVRASCAGSVGRTTPFPTVSFTAERLMGDSPQLPEFTISIFGFRQASVLLGNPPIVGTCQGAEQRPTTVCCWQRLAADEPAPERTRITTNG